MGFHGFSIWFSTFHVFLYVYPRVTPHVCCFFHRLHPAPKDSSPRATSHLQAPRRMTWFNGLIERNSYPLAIQDSYWKWQTHRFHFQDLELPSAHSYWVAKCSLILNIQHWTDLENSAWLVVRSPSFVSLTQAFKYPKYPKCASKTPFEKKLWIATENSNHDASPQKTCWCKQWKLATSHDFHCFSHPPGLSDLDLTPLLL